MADQVGRAALTIGGGIFFGPVGALVGGILGDVLFPAPSVKGPRLNELNLQRSTVGQPVPIVYGTAALAGNVIWSGGLVEHEGESGGKGGGSGPATTTYTYSVDVAIGICEGPIDGVRRIWADADLIYDASDDATLAERLGNPTNVTEVIAGIRAMSAQLNFELYLGTDDQLPDPTIQSYENVGYVGNIVPAYRGLAYIVFPEFQLAKFGNRIPNFRFEVYTGAPTECGIYSAGSMFPWREGLRDPRNVLNNHTYNGGGGFTTDLAAALADLPGSGWVLGSPMPGSADSPTVHSWYAGGATNKYCAGDLTEDRLEIQLSVNRLHASVNHVCDIAFFDDLPNSFVSAFGIGNLVWWGGGGVPGADRGYYVAVPDGSSPAGYFEGNTPTGSFNAELFDNADVYYLVDEELEVRRTFVPPDPCAFGTPLVGSSGYCVVNGQVTQGITWTLVSGTFKVLQKYRTSTISFDPTVVWDYPVDPCLRNDDPNYNNQAFWEAAHAAALASGDYTGSIGLDAGDVYGVDYPDTQDFAYFSECDTVEAECVPMAIIVADICRRAGLRTDTATQIDVSGLTTCVPGYIIGRQMSARDALGPLRLFGLWDTVESDALLRFVERGAAIVATLTSDDLGAHEHGSQAPTAVEVSRVQEKDLPRRLRLHFANFLHDHEASEQSASRLATEAIDELDVEIPISMEPDTAAQLAEVALFAQWVGRNTQRFWLDHNWLALEPTDCLEIPVDGQTERVRILAVNYKIGGILEVEAQRDDDGSYVSTAVATPGTPSGGVPGSGGSALICPSGLVLLDLPRLNSAHVDAGYYAAVYNTCGDVGWTCAEIYRSDDGGLTYARVARTDQETTVGEIVTITGPATDPTLPGESPAYDTATAITVSLFEGTLSSITDAQIAAGQNMAAIGVDGRWVIIQFKTATFDTGATWVLTDLIWGLNGTQPYLYTTVDGDTFVLLSDPALLRIPESPNAIGVEKQFKAVTCGEAIDAVTEQDFTTWGLSYLRLCPSSVISATLATPPVAPSDGDAYLLPNDTSLAGDWAEHGGEIAHWSDETGAWVFCTPVPGTIITIGADSPSDPGDGAVISDGTGNYNPAPWTPAIPPLPAIDSSGDIDASYFVAYTGTGYVKVLGSELGGTGGGFPNATYITLEDESADLPNSLRVLAGSGIAIDVDTGNTVTIRRSSAGIPGTSSFIFVDEDTITGSAVTSFTISGLDLDADECYYLAFQFKNPTISTPNVSLYFNGDTTATNYHAQIIGATGATIGTTNQNNAQFQSQLTASTGYIDGYMFIRRGQDGKARAISYCNRVAGGTATGFQLGQVCYDTSANVTSITILSSVASSLDVGGKITIWAVQS